MNKEIHIWMCGGYPIEDTDCDLYLAQTSLANNKPIIHTTQPSVCHTNRFTEGYRIFVHMIDSDCVEIVLGDKNKNTRRDIKMTHNLEKLLLANEFGKATEDKSITEKVHDKKDYMPIVNGRSFFCKCGANVFKRVWDNEYGEIFVCNGCGTEYSTN